jgi:hypothetical protein
MERIFDQREALLALGCLEELQTKHNKALDLLKDFSIVVQDDRGADYHLLYQYKDFLEK